MAVVFDAVGPSSAGATASSSTSLSWSHTCTGSNLALIVGATLGMGSGADGGFSMSATYNSVSMTSLGLIHGNNSTFGFVQLWVLAAPATGANTVAITASGGTPSTLVGGSVSFTGVDQVAPTRGTVTAAGNSATASVVVTGTASSSMVVDAVGAGQPVTSSTQTLQWSRNAASFQIANAAQSTSAAGGSVTMSYAITSDYWGIVAVEVLASSPVYVPTVAPSVAAISRSSTW